MILKPQQVLLGEQLVQPGLVDATEEARGWPSRQMRHALFFLLKDPPGGVRQLLHHHEHEKQMTAAERERLVSEGTAVQGMVVHSEPSGADRRVSQVRISVRFKDGQTVEFSEELANLYQPAPGSPEAQRLAEVRGAEH